MTVEVYGRQNCSFCTKAKTLLTIKKEDFIYKELDTDFTLEEFREKFPDAKTVPQIIVDGKHIGGYDALEAYYKNLEKD